MSAPTSGEGQGPRLPSSLPGRPSGQADKCGHRFWSPPQSPVPTPVLLGPLNSRTAPYGVSGLAPQHHLSLQGPGLSHRGDNSGHSSNLELFSPYQLVPAGPPTLTPRVGPRLAVSLGRRGQLLSSMQSPSSGDPFPAGEGSKARDLTPLFCPKPANHPASLSPTPGGVAQSLRASTPICTHPCPVPL